MTADIQSISAIINKALQPKGISVRVAQKADTLQIFLQSAQPINKEAVATFLTNGVKKLNVDGISKLAVYAKQTGATAVSWTAQADIASVLSKTSCQESLVETAKSAKKQNDFSDSKISTQKSLVPTTKPAKKQSGSPWLGAGTLITLIISLPTIVLFLIPAAIALAAQTFFYSKGERDKTKLGELSCKYFIGSFWGLIALTGVSITLFPDLHKPATVSTTAPSPVAAPEDKAKAILARLSKETNFEPRVDQWGPTGKGLFLVKTGWDSLTDADKNQMIEYAKSNGISAILVGKLVKKQPRNTVTIDETVWSSDVKTAAPVDSPSDIGKVDQTGVKITVDVPKDPVCSRTRVSIKIDTFEKCLIEGLTYVQVANVLGYRGELQTKSGNAEIYQWNDGLGKYLSATFVNGKLMSKAQIGLEPGS